MSEVLIFGRRLKALREAAGLTQTDLATRAGLHRQGIVKLERGEREPAWATVLTLADALGVSCEAFKGEGGELNLEPARRGRPPKAAPSTPPAEAPEDVAKAPARKRRQPVQAKPKGRRGPLH